MTATLQPLQCSALELTELRSASELQSLATEWHDLWLTSRQAPFQSPMWLLPWIEQFTSSNMCALVVRAFSRLVAIAPFYTWNDGSATILLLAGNGISDYLDICFDPQYESQLTSALAAWLAQSDEWDDCEFNQIPITSPLIQLGQSRANADPCGEPCPILDLTAKSVKNYAPARQLEKLLYYRRRAGKQGPCEIVPATAGNAPEVMRELFRLHNLRWRSRGENGLLQNPEIQQFHLDVAARLARAGNLRLDALVLNGQIIGAMYAFADASATYYYLSGFDPEFEKISPGTLLIGHAIERAISEGHTQFNFLRGSEPYKYAWGAKEQPTLGCRFNHSSPALLA
jgi:CelD/BcsL family acetyltransferase involved in cellulose biosynthesis